MPFLLLPFRPGLDPIGSKNFIRNYFRVLYEEADFDPDSKRSESFARRELRLMEPIVSIFFVHDTISSFAILIWYK
jgi:hypothetical protein